MCFIGHGAFGIITKAAWLPYFGVVGIGEAWAWRLMPWIGSMDVAMGFLALIWPCRALFAWATVWGIWTALLRPLAGQGWPEFFERAGNFGGALSILAVVGLRGGWFSRLADCWPEFSGPVRARLGWVLRGTTATLLAGHAGCALVLQKPSLVQHYEVFFGARSYDAMLWVGRAEIAMALIVLVLPRPAILVGVCGWKLASESLFLLGGTTAPAFEVIERGGSYAVPLALALLLAVSAEFPRLTYSADFPRSPNR